MGMFPINTTQTDGQTDRRNFLKCIAILKLAKNLYTLLHYKSEQARPIFSIFVEIPQHRP